MQFTRLGDIGNITIGEDGTGSIKLTTDLWEIGTGSDIDVVGKGIIVHAGADDFTSQPSGNAGARVDCIIAGEHSQFVVGKPFIPHPLGL